MLVSGRVNSIKLPWSRMVKQSPHGLRNIPPPNVWGQSSYDVKAFYEAPLEIGVSYCKSPFKLGVGKIRRGQNRKLHCWWTKKQPFELRMYWSSNTTGTINNTRAHCVVNESSKSFNESFVNSSLNLTWLEYLKVILEGVLPLSHTFVGGGAIGDTWCKQQKPAT